MPRRTSVRRAQHQRLQKKLSPLRLAGLLVVVLCTLLAPVFMVGMASAGQLSMRSVTPNTSKVSAAVSFAVSFRVSQAAEVEGIVIQFCNNSPIIATSCTNTSGVSSTQDAPSTVSVTQDGNTVVYDVDAISDTTGKVVLTKSVGITPSNIGSQAMTFTLSGINPSVTGTHYIRLLTYNTVAGAIAYSDTVPGTHLDDGAVALAINNQLTVNARVQEVLQFCVGTTDAATTNDCADISGTSVDLGVVDSSAIAVTGNSAGKAMLRTNAVNGAQIVYFAEQALSGTTHLGALRVAGATCSGSGAIAGGATTDQCFNSSPSAVTFSIGTEAFGMTVTGVDTTNGTTTNLVRDADYDVSTEYAWRIDGVAEILATAANVVDDEMLDLKFAATASATTPTGAYSVTATFIATGTF